MGKLFQFFKLYLLQKSDRNGDGKLYPQDKKNLQLASIYLRFKDGRGIDLTVKTPFSALKTHWDKRNQKIHNKEDFSQMDVVEINNHLNIIKTMVLNSYNLAVLKGVPTDKDWLQRTISGQFKNNQEMTLLKLIEDFIKKAESGELATPEGKRYTKGSLYNYKQLKSKLDEFSLTTRIIGLDDVNSNFYDAWIKFMNDKKLSANTVGKHISRLKRVMNYGLEKKLHTNRDFEFFKKIREEPTAIYLTEEELQRIIKLNYKENKSRELARDIFIVGCYTGQRFSDYSKLTPDNLRKINGTEYLHFIQQKTGKEVIIPMHPIVKGTLDKYDFTLPKISDVELNRQIKEIGRKARINDSIVIEKTLGGRRIKETYNKYALIQSHTARRSLLTNCWLSGMPTSDLMRISGHSSEKDLLRYLKQSKEEAAVKLGEYKFFKEKL